MPAYPHPLQQQGRPSVAQATAAPHDFQLEMVEPQITLGQRSWLWRFHLNDAGRELAMERIAALQVLLPTIIDGFIRHGVLEPTASLRSAYVIGSYPWVTNPTDIDFFLIVEGEQDYTYFSSQQLKARDIQMPELPALPALETVGHDTLLQAYDGEPVPQAKRLALRYTLLYGSTLLAGRDIFETTAISPEALKALRKDLLEDRKRADWPELNGDATRIKAKRKWRRSEANALRKFSSLLQRAPRNHRYVPKGQVGKG